MYYLFKLKYNPNIMRSPLVRIKPEIKDALKLRMRRGESYSQVIVRLANMNMDKEQKEEMEEIK